MKRCSREPSPRGIHCPTTVPWGTVSFVYRTKWKACSDLQDNSVLEHHKSVPRGRRQGEQSECDHFRRPPSQGVDVRGERGPVVSRPRSMHHTCNISQRHEVVNCTGRRRCRQVHFARCASCATVGHCGPITDAYSRTYCTVYEAFPVPAPC